MMEKLLTEKWRNAAPNELAVVLRHFSLNNFSARLLCILIITAAFEPAWLSARTVLEAGNSTQWKYLDDAAEPDPGWRQASYDDSHWKSGHAPLGFGERRITTQVNSGPDVRSRPITTWFRRPFEAPQLRPGERLVVLLSVDDGAILYLNGYEVARVNMPPAAVDSATFASRALSDDAEGYYHRLPIPLEPVRQGQTNVVAVEVHQASSVSSDLFFDLALKVLPALEPEAEVQAAAREVIELYHRRHCIGPGVRIPDGYLDGGRRMLIDTAGRAASRREILLVNRARDVELAADLAFARSDELRAMPELGRAQRIVAHIDSRTTPPGGPRWVFATAERLEIECANKPVLIGDWVDQCQAGVCRHRALLFKVLADEAGLRAALVRGNLAHNGPPGFAHAWNELELEDGRHLLVDIMRNGRQPTFPATDDRQVIEQYLKVDGTAWYDHLDATENDAP